MAALWQDCTIAGVFGQKSAEFVANGRGKVETDCIPKSDSPDLGPTFDIHEGKDMKKVLLATTILGMTAGYAAAEIAFTGEATAGFASANGGDFDTYTSFNLGVAATAESDSGVTFGASFDATSGVTFDFDGDASHFSDDPSEDEETGAFGNPEVFISGDFGRVAFSVDGYNDFHEDDDEGNDLEYTHTIGDFSIGLRTDIDNGTSSLQLGYTVANFDLGANFDEATEEWDVSAEGTFDAVTVGLSLDDAEVATVNLGYAANGVSVGLEIDTNDDYTVSAGYEANGLSVNAEIDEDSVWEVTAGYDLGNGLAVEAGLHESESAFLGAKMSF
jgi:outer membrane protein OmpU